MIFATVIDKPTKKLHGVNQVRNQTNSALNSLLHAGTEHVCPNALWEPGVNNSSIYRINCSRWNCSDGTSSTGPLYLVYHDYHILLLLDRFICGDEITSCIQANARGRLVSFLRDFA